MRSWKRATVEDLMRPGLKRAHTTQRTAQTTSKCGISNPSALHLGCAGCLVIGPLRSEQDGMPALAPGIHVQGDVKAPEVLLHYSQGG